MTTAEVPVFDVREFARTARGSHRSELDFDALSRVRLTPDTARLIRVLRDLERSTMQRMRNLLVTATHKDARVTAFLTTWAYERFWVADALDAVIEATGAADDTGDATGAPRHSFGERAERRGPVRRAISAGFAGSQLVAAHVTAGLVDEWITSAAYRRLATAASELSSVVQIVLSVKERHIRFLWEEAERRLAASSRAQRLTRRELQRQVWPIGAIELSADDRAFFGTFVFGDEQGRTRLAEIADRILTLPRDLGGLDNGQAHRAMARLVP